MHERGRLVEIGESFVGEGAEAAHINTVFGGHDGPVRVDVLAAHPHQEKIMNAGDTHATAERNAGAAIDAVAALRERVGLTALIADFGITEADYAQIAADALDDEVLANTPRRPDGDDIGAILLASGG